MATQSQLFDGGVSGGPINWDTTDAIGDPLWFAGVGSATFTATEQIHGSTAAHLTKDAGSGSATLVLTPTASTREFRAQAYYRVPATGRPASGDLGLMYVSSQNTGIHVRLGSDGALGLSSWQGQIGAWSAPGAVTAGDVIRVAIRAIASSSSSVTAAVFKGESTTPIWEATGALTAVTATDTFENIQFGMGTTSDPSLATSYVIDSIREEDGPGTAAAFLPPELNDPATRRRHQTWVLIGTTWTNLGTRRQIPAT